MKAIVTLMLALMAMGANAQEIAGTVLNDEKQPVILGAILIKQNGVLKGGACTDYDGNYSAKPLEPGTYNVIAFFNGYDTLTITGVPVVAEKRTVQNFIFSKAANPPGNIVRPYKKQLSNEINKPPAPNNAKAATEIADWLYLIPSGCQAQRGRGLNIASCRGDKVLYIIDPIQVSTIPDLSMSRPATLMPLNHNYPTLFSLTRKDIQSLPATEIHDMVALSPLAYQQRRGVDVRLSGADAYGTLYIVDGMQIAR